MKVTIGPVCGSAGQRRTRDVQKVTCKVCARIAGNILVGDAPSKWLSRRQTLVRVLGLDITRNVVERKDDSKEEQPWSSPIRALEGKVIHEVEVCESAKGK
jgi:hypothetical protein